MILTTIISIPFQIGWVSAAMLQQQPLDDRINPDRITTLGETAATGTTTPPPLPVHRITTDARLSLLPPLETVRTRLALEKGVRWLLAHQDAGGGWGGGSTTTPTNDPEAPPTPTAAAITGLGIMAIAQSGLVDTRLLTTAIERLRLARRQDFGIDHGPLSTYVLATITSGLASLEDPAFDELVAEGVSALRRHQWDEGEGLLMTQDWYGGAGYGTRGRPDLSNTQMMLDALYDAGIGPDDPAFQRAVTFLSRCQNLNTTNPATWAGTDGGFVYTAANGGESLASEAEGHGRHGDLDLAKGEPRRLRSYGSMTYAGFKSLLYAGLGPKDPRVRAALDWMSAHWNLNDNPGLGQQGYYYYLYTMARALRASGLDSIRTADGVRHDWRSEMASVILSRQQEDGSWINTTDRWLEGRQDLTTIYATLALEEILKPRPTKPEDPSP
ncbi:MAG: hypothetical protein VX527_02970 [Planctomycetota bacterium]|nr:hypothetical protein [Planctomycetota bacterium]